VYLESAIDPTRVTSIDMLVTLYVRKFLASYWNSVWSKKVTLLVVAAERYPFHIVTHEFPEPSSTRGVTRSMQHRISFIAIGLTYLTGLAYVRLLKPVRRRRIENLAGMFEIIIHI